MERGYFSAFLSQFSADRLPLGPALAGMMGTMAFAVEGYDADSRGDLRHPRGAEVLRSLPLVMALLAVLLRPEPGQPEDDGPVLPAQPDEGGPQGRPLAVVELDPLELPRWVAADFDPMNELCERAGLSERAIYGRSKTVFEYFGFPYDAPPPE